MSLYFSSQVFVIAALVCSVLTVLFGAAATHQKDRETTKLNEEHKSELLGKSEEIATLNARIINLQGKGMDELLHQTALLTGGNSFPVMSFVESKDSSPRVFHADLWVRGKYPLRDFTYRGTITSSKNIQRIQGSTTVLRPASPTKVSEIPIEITLDNETVFRATFFANNGVWHQTTTFRLNSSHKVEMKTILHPDNNKDLLLVKTEFGQGLPVGTFEDYYATRYQP